MNDLTAFARLFELRTVSRWVGLGLLVGVVSGLAAGLFFVAIDLVRYLALGKVANIALPAPAGDPPFVGYQVDGSARAWALVLVPALGGLLSGLVVHLFRAGRLPQGHDGLIHAFHHRHGQQSLRAPVARVLGAVAVLGSGGSAGREGAIAHLGAGLGNLISRALNLSDRERRLLLLAGAAGGIAAIFRSPLGAALFVLEVLYRDDFEADAIVPTVLSSVVGYSVFTMIFGQSTIFQTAESYVFTPLQLPFYLAMAVFLALAGVAFVWVLRWSEARLFARLPLPDPVKSMLGGAVVGLIALFEPQVLGTGYGTLQLAMQSGVESFGVGWFGVVSLLVIGAAKLVATTATMSSGGSGGVFGPSVVIGGLLGGTCGLAFHELAPGVVTQPGAFVIVGMASFLGGVAKAPISTLVMASEMTGSYDLLVPVMLAEVVTFAMTRGTQLYRHQVLSRRDSRAHGGEYAMDLLKDLSVHDIYTRDLELLSVPASTPLPALLRRASESSQAAFPIIDPHGKLDGLVTLDSLRAAFMDDELHQFAIAADCAGPFVSLAPETDLAAALATFSAAHCPQLPVVDPSQPNRVLGLLSYEQLLSAYSEEMIRRRLDT